MVGAEVRCIECGARLPLGARPLRCPRCGGLLEVDHRPEPPDYARLRALFDARPLGVWRYREMLPLAAADAAVTLGEGGTPLLPARALAADLGLEALYVKYEGLNPTGSFKDRGMTLGVTAARRLGAPLVACASTGNTAASLAAYAGAAGLPCLVLVPAGGIALGKLAQALVHGATVVAVRGGFDDALGLALAAAEELGLYLLNSLNPLRMEGQKTAAYEVVDQLAGRAPDWVVCPVGNGNNLASYWKGFEEFRRLGAIAASPRLAGVQAEGAAPIARAVAEGRQKIVPVAEPTTVASAIRIGHPANWRKTLGAIYGSRGTATAVADGEILEAQGLLARREGLFVEPASAAGLAGLRRLVDEGTIGGDDLVVLVATGHGLKDPQAALLRPPPPREIGPSLGELRALVSALLPPG